MSYKVVQLQVDEEVHEILKQAAKISKKKVAEMYLKLLTKASAQDVLENAKMWADVDKQITRDKLERQRMLIEAEQAKGGETL